MPEDNEPDIYKHFGAYPITDQRHYDHFNVKRGLRNADGTGVVAGLTSISDVHGYNKIDGVTIPDEGRLLLRGYSLTDLVDNVVSEHRPGFEELAYLLWSGDLPRQDQLVDFQHLIDEWRDLPRGFVAGLVMNAPSENVMNMIGRSILLLYAQDPKADSLDAHHEIDTAIQLISRIPRIAVLSYLAMEQQRGAGMYINPPRAGLSTAETILYMLRPNADWKPQEARMLDIMLMLHAEHGGGNNSTFSTRVLTSSGTDAYSAYSAGISSLKGPRHGGANIKVVQMHEDLMSNVSDWEDEGKVADYLTRVLHKEAFDQSGLIYGMGHAVYTKSDPRAQICRKYATEIAKGTEYEPQLELLKLVERITPEVFAREKGIEKPICANIDMYSGLVYKILGIPSDLFTPLFAVARLSGWAAHRFEEIVSARRIIRPAYRTIQPPRDYVPIGSRADAILHMTPQEIEEFENKLIYSTVAANARRRFDEAQEKGSTWERP